MPISNRKELMYQVMENMIAMIRIVDINNNIIYMNRSIRDEFGDRTGGKCHAMFCLEEKCDTCIGINSIKENTAQTKEVHFGEKAYRVMASPAMDSDDDKYSIEIFYDITEQKILEEESRKHYEKLKEDIEFAKQIQKKALPKDGTYWNSVKTYSSYFPSEDLSGDLFDIVKADDDNIVFYIADVSGHGVRSSLLTIFLRQVIRGMKESAADPTSALDKIINDYKDLNLDKENYISLIYGVYNKKTRGMSLVNAGHNCLPIVIEKKGENDIKLTELDVRGMPICSLLSSASHAVRVVQMEKGDKILLYTDGITEAFNNDDNKAFGLSRLKQTIYEHNGSEGKELVDKIIKKARRFAGNSSVDDMAALVLELI
jgi:sigma-B regulation protein RsbU (phosphoserine phosphatase)